MPANTPGHAEEEHSLLSRFVRLRAKRRRMWMTEAVRQGSEATATREDRFMRCALEFLLRGQKEPKSLRLTPADPAKLDRYPAMPGWL